MSHVRSLNVDPTSELFRRPSNSPPIQPCSSPCTAMSRSRNGCNTCKRRHRKCDETRPVCQACQGQGLECEGYNLVLRWNVGVASRGHLTGVTSPVRSTHVAETIAPDTLRCIPPTRDALDTQAYSPPESLMHTSRQEKPGSYLHKEQHETAKDCKTS